MNLGAGYGEAAGAVIGIASKALSKKKKPGAAGNATMPNITVSPAIQTRISPQISPVMTQMQSSPGATATGAPQMITTAPQIAETGVPMPGVPPTTRAAPPRYSPFDNYGRPHSSFPSYYGPSDPIVTKQGMDTRTMVTWGVAGVAIIALLAAMRNRPPVYRPKRTKRKGRTYKGKYKRLT